VTSDLHLRLRLGSGEVGTGGGDERPVGREHARARPGASYLTRDANDRGSAVAAKKAGLRATCLLLDASPATPRSVLASVASAPFFFAASFLAPTASAYPESDASLPPSGSRLRSQGCMLLNFQATHYVGWELLQR
jgi:hypothetical protein